MKLVRKLLFFRKKKEETGDYYQESLNKLGKEQLKRLVEKGLSVPIAIYSTI